MRILPVNYWKFREVYTMGNRGICLLIELVICLVIIAFMLLCVAQTADKVLESVKLMC